MDSLNFNTMKVSASKFYTPSAVQPKKKKEGAEVQDKVELGINDYQSGRMMDIHSLNNSGTTQEVAPPTSGFPTPPTPEKELTVLFYMHGQYKDIGEATGETMLNLERAGSDERVNVVAQLGRFPYQADPKDQELGEFHIPIDGDWSGVRRYEVKQDDHSALDMSTQDWEKLDKQLPDNPLMKFVMGNVYWGMGDKVKAKEYYDKSKELGMLEYMANTSSDKSKAIRKEFNLATRPYDEAMYDKKIYASDVKGILSDDTKMGDPATLKDFVQWGMEKYPAKHYMLVIMGHGGAWIGAAEQPPSKMANAIREGVKEANQQTGRDDKLDMLLFNSCYMGNAEALYEFHDLAKVSMASENYATTGIFKDWGGILTSVQKDLESGKPFDAQKLGSELVEHYREKNIETKENFPEFEPWKRAFLTLSAIDNEKFPAFAQSWKNFTDQLKENKVPPHILFKDVKATKDYASTAPNPSQLFGFYDTIRDIGDFMDKVGKNPEIPQGVKDSAQEVKARLKDVVINEQHEGKGMEGSQGLTFWGPGNGVDIAFMGNRYGDDVGKFAKETGWNDQLKFAFQSIPKPVVTGFMDNIAKVREINNKLDNPNLSEAEKKELTSQKETYNKAALELKKQMELDIERSAPEGASARLFKSRGMGLEQYADLIRDVTGEILQQDGMV